MPHEDFAQFEALKTSGASPEEVFLAAEKARDRMAAFRAVRVVFSLSVPQAKEVMLRAYGEASSLDEHEESLLPALKQALSGESGHSDPSRTA